MMIPRSQQPSAAEVEAALERVYARPEFSARQPPSWLQAIHDAVVAIREAITGMLLDVIEAVHSVAGSGFGRWLIAGVALWVVWVIISRLARGDNDMGRARNGGPVERASRVPTDTERDAEHWHAEAERAMAAGRFRDAAFAHYHAVVLRLDERGVLRFDAAKTPGDYRREVSRHAEASRVLNGFLRIFEPLAWGRYGENAEALEQLRAAAAEAGGRG